MKIQPNSRQIPSVEIYTADKKYDDLLYGVLQEKSYNEVVNGVSTRYVDKKDVNFSKLCDEIGLTRQTTSKKFENLITIGLVEEDTGGKKKRYILNELDSSVASLVPYETLRKINHALSQYAISLFVYLLNRYIANKEEGFIATLTQMKAFVGIATTTPNNNVIITDILDILSLIGLVEWGYERLEDNRVVIKIHRVSNIIKSIC